MIILSIPINETLKNIADLVNNYYSSNSYQNLSVDVWEIIKDWGIYCLTFCHDFVHLSVFSPPDFNSIFADIPGMIDLNIDLNFDSNIDLNFDLNFDLNNERNREILYYILFGFLNCFFLYIPVSATQLIWLHYVIIEEVKIAPTIGLILGNLSFIACCLFGFREIIYGWFGLEPLNFFVGAFIILTVIFRIYHNPININRIFKVKVKIKELLKIAFIQFILAWTDQPIIFPFLSTLTIHNGITPLNNEQYFYFLGLILGSFFWTFIIVKIFILLEKIITTLMKFPTKLWKKGLNNFCIIGSIALVFASFNYYDPGYLFSNPLGFVPDDQVWEATDLPLLKIDLKDREKGRLGDKSVFESVDTDISLFDRATYTSGPVVEFHPESLNYKREYAWRARIDRISTRRRSEGILDKYIALHFNKSENPFYLLKQKERKKQLIRRLKKYQKLHELNKLPNKKQNFEEPIFEFNQFRLGVFGELIARYIEDYCAEANANDEDREIPSLNSERMIYFSAFSESDKYGFDPFSMFEPLQLDHFDYGLEKEMKERYSENLLNRALLYLDISTLIRRQPYHLTTQDEIDLFEKRKMLTKYYDTLREYSHIPIKSNFKALFNGPKSYINRIYNQQFKGTFKIIDRLFSIHLEKPENIPVLVMPKGDEEFLANSQNTEEENEYLYLKKDPSVFKFDQPLYKKDYLIKNPLIHEQLLDKETIFHELEKFYPFIFEEKPIPFFVGWDNEQRKFILTNRLLTREKTLSDISYVNKNFRYLKKKPESDTLTFTTWPVTEEALKENLEFSRLFRVNEEISLSDNIFKYIEPPADESTVVYKKLPNVVKRLELKIPAIIESDIVPRRGGFFWPGKNVDIDIFDFLRSKISLLK